MLNRRQLLRKHPCLSQLRGISQFITTPLWIWVSAICHPKQRPPPTLLVLIPLIPLFISRFALSLTPSFFFHGSLPFTLHDSKAYSVVPACCALLQLCFAVILPISSSARDIPQFHIFQLSITFHSVYLDDESLSALTTVRIKRPQGENAVICHSRL